MDRNDLIREIQERYREADRSFNERERRHWAAREAIELGRGGITLVSQALRMSPNTIKRGIREITTAPADPSPSSARIRKSGGGRKPKRTLSIRSVRTNLIEDSAGAGSAQTALDLTPAGTQETTHSASEKRRPRHSEAG